MSEFRSDDWNIYRTRFLVSAKRLTRPLTFTDPLGREHQGRPGDYLVQSSNGLLRIAPREINREEPKAAFEVSSSERLHPVSAAGTMHI